MKFAHAGPETVRKTKGGSNRVNTRGSTQHGKDTGVERVRSAKGVSNRQNSYLIHDFFTTRLVTAL